MLSGNAQLPNCNIYGFTVNESPEGFKLSDPQFLSAFNDQGYNNQAAFFGDELIYFTTNYYDNDKTEIASLDLSSNTLERRTYTSESEYSPTIIPGNKSFSTVRVEKDMSSQILCVYPLDKISYPQKLLPQTNNIGYHCWLGEKKLALFLLGEPDEFYLAIYEPITGKKKIILDRIGRTLKSSQSDELYFVHKVTDENWYLKAYNTGTKKINSLHSYVYSR